MRRREFIACLGTGVAAWPFAARAQQPDRKRLVGLVTGLPESEVRPLANGFRERMRKLGWIDGRNFTIDVRASAENSGQLDADVRALVDARVDVIVAVGSPTLAVVNRNTRTVPVVFLNVA